MADMSDGTTNAVIHDTVIVDAGVSIGTRTIDSHWVHVRVGARIGERLGDDLVCPGEGRRYRMENDCLVEVIVE